MKREKVANVCDQGIAVSFYGLIFFLPISTALTETFSTLAFLFYVIKRTALFFGALKDSRKSALSIRSVIEMFVVSFRPVASPLNRPLGFFIVVCGVSIFVSQYPHLSINAFFGKILQSAFIFFTFMESMQKKERISLFLLFWFSSCTVVCFSGIYQYYMDVDFIRQNVLAHGRVSSSLRQANDFAAYLQFILPVLLCLWILSYSKKFLKLPANDKTIGTEIGQFFLSWEGKVILLLMLFLGLSCFGLTYSRGAWLAFVFGLLLLSFKNKKLAFWLIGIAVVFIFFFTSKMILERDHMGIANFWKSSDRWVFWEAGWQIIKSNPILGIGLNNYSVVAKDYMFDGGGGYPHNSYLQLTAELGFVGLGVFLWIIAVLFKQGWQASVRMQDPFLSAVSVGSFAGLGAFLAHSFLDTFFYSTQLSSLMWVMIGLIFALNAMGAKGASSHE